MKFLFRSSDALCLPQALRVKAEGNKVKLSVHRPEFDKMGDGLIDKSVSFDRDVEWADVVIYDVQDGPLFEEADEVRKQKPTLGACAFGRQLEHDRKFGLDFARTHGVKCPDMTEFSGSLAFVKAREFLRAKDRKIDWVLKVNGKAPEGVGTFVSKDGRSGALRMLEHWEAMYKSESIKPDFVISQKIDGCEISTEAWFNGHDFYLPNHTIEKNKLFPGDLGEKVGCCGNVVWAVNRDSPLVQKLLVPLIGDLAAAKFVGPLDVNVILEKGINEPVFLEYSPRFGYDAIFSLMELVPEFGQFLYEVAQGQPASSITKDEFVGDVRLHIPPFPAKGSKDASEECVGVPIFGLKTTHDPHFHLVEVMLNANDELVTSGPHGYVMSVSGTGSTPRYAQEDAYKNLEAIHIPNMRYRNDLVDAIGEVYDKIESTGWLSSPKPESKSLMRAMSRRGR